MSSEKRFFLFIILSFIILLAFRSIYSPQIPQKENIPVLEQAQANQTITQVISQETTGSKEIQTLEYETDDYIITLSTTGGYIKKVMIKVYGEELLYQDFLVMPEFRDKEFRFEKIPQGFRLIYSGSSAKVVKEVRFNKPYVWLFSITTSTPNSYALNLFTQLKDKGFYSRYQELLYKQNSQISRIGFGKVKESLILNQPSLLGARGRYYASILLSPKQDTYVLARQNDRIGFIWKPQNPLSSYRGEIFLGPQDIEILKDYGLEDIIYFGFFHAIGMLVLQVLHFFFSLFGNWGLSIIAVSFLIYIIFFPLTAKGTKAMKKMQEKMHEIQPKIEELKKKYKDNPGKLNKETMELYKKYEINPLSSLGGCLPMFLQIPIFFSLFQVLNRSIEIKGAHFLWIKDLSQPDYLIRFPLSLPIIGDGLHILPLFMVLIMFLQQKLTTPQVQSQSPEQQKLMAVLFPLLFGFIFYKFPSGLVLYWACNSLFTFLYQLKLAKTQSS